MNRSEEMERAVNSFCENHFSQLSQLSLASSTVEANLFQLTSMVKQVGLFQQVWNDLDETIRHQQNHYFLPLKEDLLVEMHEFHRNHLNGFFKEVSIRSKMRLIDNQLTLLEAQIEQVMQKEYTKLSQRLLEINELPRLIQYGFSRLVVETIASTLESLKGLSLPEGETQEIKVLNFLNTILTLSSEMNKERKIEFLTTSIQELLNNKPEENLILLNSHFEKLFQLDLKEFKRCRDNVMEVLISQTRSELDAALQTQQDNDCCNSSEIQKYIVRGEGILQLPACFKNGAESEALVASIKERLRLHEIRQRAREIQFYELLLPTFVLQTIEKIRLENFKQFEKILSLKLDVSDVEGSLNKLGPVAGIIEFVNIWKQLCRAILTEKQRYSLIADEDLIKIKNDFEVILKKDLANILIMAQGLNLVKQYEKELDNLKREVEEVIKKNPALIVTKGIKIEAGINARVIKALEQNKIEWQKLEASASHDMKGELSMLRKEVEDKENILNQYMFSEADKKNLASIVSAITQACIKDELSMIIDQLPDMLATLYNHKELHNKAIGELISNLNRQQNPVDIHNYLVSENYTAIINIYALLTKAQNLLKEHFSLDIAQLVKTTCVHIDSLQNEALQEINSSAFSTSFFELRKLRSFCNVLTALTNLKLTKSSADVLRSFRNIVKERWNIYVNDLPRNTAILSPEAKRNLVSGITQELIKQQEVATQLSLLSDYKTYMSRALKLLQKDLIVQMGTLLAEYALKEDPFISGSAKGVLATFSDFRSVDRSYWQEKASVTFEEALPKLTSLPVLDIGSQDRIRQAYHIYNQAYNEYINLIHFKKFQKDQHITETRKLAAKINPESFYFNLKEVSELLASICALWTFLDADTDAFSLVDSRFLIQPHSTQILTILSLIGVAQPGKIANHLAQVGTGEGKSISLGILSTLFALVGYDVSVVCYSSYLSKRDRKLFSNLFGQFGVEQKIQYCTIKKLMEAQLNASLPDFRGQAQSFLRGETVVPFIQKVVKKSLLLIDEVDVFFGEFYGRLHGSLVSVISPAVEELIRYIWEQRNDLKQLDNKKALNLLKSLTCSKNILREFPNLSPFFLGELTKMFEVATNFPGEPIHSRYRIKQDQIYYIDDAGNLNPFIKDGYHTAFAYLYNFDQGLIRNKERVSQELVIYLKCSDVLYSEIPKNYSLRLGLTATLSGLSKGENLVLNDYKFTKRSFIPSTFKKKPITRGETLVFSGERNKEYFEAIKNDIFQIVSQGRASLVVFDTLEYLDAFRDYLTRVQRKVDHYFEAEVLSEAVSDSEKAAVVLKSINQYRTTFITRRYGRGTDFVCRNSALEKCGGVHVILTFFPETLTEEEQIFGRTGRQDNPGTVRYILFAGDLLAQKFVPARIQDGAEIPDLSSIDCSFSLSSSPKPDWDGYLNKERKKKDAIRYKAIMAYLAKNKEIHQQSLQLSKAMERSDKNVVMKILSEWNKE